MDNKTAIKVMLCEMVVKSEDITTQNDIETLTDNIAERIVKLFAIPDFSQQSELFFELLKYAMPTNYTDEAIKSVVAQFIDSKNCG